MNASPARPLAMIALTALCAVATGCGNDVPPSAVAKIGDSTISKDEFNRWLTSAAAGAQAQGGSSTVPDPPDFKKCIASLEAQPAPEGGQSPSGDDLKQQCEDQYDQLKGEVMQFLIQAEWVEQEAAERDIEVSDKEVRESFEAQKQKAYPKAADYKAFLEESGMSEQDILYRIKLDQLQTELTQAITKDEVKISEADVEEFYDKNRKQFARPETRDVNLVLTKTEDRANAAKAAIEGGDKFAPVAREFSIDQATKAQGGKLPDLSKGQQDQQFEQAAFSAQQDELEGPVKTQFGFYVFEVTDVTEPSQAALGDVSETIRQQLRSQREQKVLDDFKKEFREEYKDKTECAEDFRIADCGNAPKDETDPAPPAPGGAPQGAPPQGAPPQGAPPQGAPPQGVPPGAAPPGAPPQGAPPQGAPPQGVPPGAAPPGAPPQGAPPGAVPQGPQPPAGPPPQGPASP